MMSGIGKSIILGAFLSWFALVSGKLVDVFCYERGGIEPQTSDYPAYSNQEKYRLQNQNNWNLVSMNDLKSDSNSLFKYNNVPQEIEFHRNFCDNRGNQSPIILRSDNKCEDAHRARGRAIAKCAWSDMHFTVERDSLRAEFIGCRSTPRIDFSHSPAYYDLAYMELKVPSEHCIQNGDKEDCFDGEIVFVHKGTKNEKADLRDEMMNVAGLIRATDVPNEYFEMILRKWEKFQQLQYTQCELNYSTNWVKNNVTWGESLCDTKEKIRNARKFSSRHLRQDVSAFAVIPPVPWYDDVDEVAQDSSHSKEHDSQRDLKFEEDLKMYYKLLPRAPFYYRYYGSMTTPPCTNKVNWRIFTEPFFISHEQLHRAEYLIAAHVNEQCELATVGRPRGDCKVDVNREIQPLSNEHELAQCDQWNGAKWGNP